MIVPVVPIYIFKKKLLYFPLKTGKLYKMEVKNIEEKTFNRNLKMLITILYNGSQIRALAQKTELLLASIAGR